ncbi:hemolysin family protein [Micrococcus sp.]|uniref:hemolysin family protein n=1 Tax=Micrococcus sp. TaxID=1271 RepID=UPI002A908B49|nr:hemolysin family protein [Micrococcus sp.]MDY6055645.1 hemolysin family protein [Micrococcus sp.]
MEWLLLIAGLLLVFGTGFFVAVEFSMIAIDVPAVQRMVDDGDRGAEPLLRCLKSLSTQLSACQLGITLTTLLTGYVMDPAISRLVDPLLLQAGVPEAVAAPASLVVAMTLATLLSMLIGELVPKNLAIAEPLSLGRRLARPMLAFSAVFKPAILVLNGFSNRILARMGLEAKEEISGARSPEELSSLVRRSAQLGTLDVQTATFLDRTLRFAERTAADVMTPRIRMETVGVEDPLPEVVDLARSTGFSRFPVIGDSSDDVRGVVHVKKAVAVPRERREDLVAGSLMTDVIRVPETVQLDQLLSELREASLQMAIVVDEYGGTAGVVTLEDVVEEIVGEVSDEHDRVTPGVLQTASGRWYFPADLRPDEAQAQIRSLEVPEDGAYETIGGFVMARLGRIPAVGDQVGLDGGTLTVERMDGRRVERVRFDPAAEAGVEERA